MVLAKQGIDLHTSSLDQALAQRYIAEGHMERHIPNIIEMYRPRCQAMISALEQTFPDSSAWSRPDGGMFVWVECPPQVDTTALYQSAVNRRVAYVPGEYFFTEPGAGKFTMRLNFSCSNEDEIIQAVTILAELVSETIKK
jgi:2-aminoadipate transaminase